MEYCKYHPLTAASWYCSECDTHTCDTCTNETVYNDKRRCFNCGAELASLGSAYTAEPFWHHLKAMFRYPLNGSTLGLIITVAVLSSLLSFVPLVGLVAALISTGIFIKYSFRCLEETANGNMVPPDISDAYEGGIILILKMIGLLLLLGIGGGLLSQFVGPGFTGLLGMFVLLSIPAFLINFALTDSVLRSAAPPAVMRIISAVGMPYGILIGFIFLMASSVSVLSYLVSSELSLVTMILQSIISNYYMVVIFHMMGYVVFQYQEPLGFYARERLDNMPPPRTESELVKAHIDVAVKEGDYDKVISLYQNYLSKHNQDVVMYDSWFEFVLQAARRDLLAQMVDDYIHLKYQKGHKTELKRIYKQVLQLFPVYIPEDGKVRYQLAKDYFDAGDFITCVKMINGMHKKYTDLPLLIRSYMLLAEALTELKKPDQVAKCRALVAQYQKKADALKPTAEQE
ncbi:MAG: hypothetical protein CMI08_17710 [Oceanospirillaceae bacterium]|uniref:hypothetical protein n=1 Tax=unclassified Thalassolituus TaxID=2624967 RepID=UPI000C091DEA|nr:MULTISPECIES: hypothetical protein [unclassified Thalassolituus]MAK92613.1 hypothetical protein [Thalassolituus sp.]MAS26303.1 hypothetical protein [Oceanospirillaceae bacterium]MAY01003.1 hypothetical protein [Oceanospirillaceae bacterium]MBL34638.1 hypothetical protein [Oceanospirillaceae bacterium]MBS52492.1 hypothetical protein [Oceanospirillaceae bacterium]|tara:strand:+ start:3761 stop:5134 length:1374 start_codon:yes stop_codon:yes gene_type:complete